MKMKNSELICSNMRAGIILNEDTIDRLSQGSTHAHVRDPSESCMIS